MAQYLLTTQHQRNYYKEYFLMAIFNNETAHLICTVMPAGMEDMFLESRKPVTQGTFLPLPETNPALIQQMKTVSEKYSQQLFPPDYLDQ